MWFQTPLKCTPYHVKSRLEISIMDADFMRKVVVTVLVPASSTTPLTELLEDISELEQRDILYFGM